MNHRMKGVAVAIVLVLVAGGVWYWLEERNGLPENIEQGLSELAEASSGGPSDFAKMESLHKQAATLPPGQQAVFQARMHRSMQEAMERRMGEFFALSQKERAHFLDREIEKMELLSRAPSSGPVRIALPAGGHPGEGDEAGGDVFIGGPPSISPKMRAQMAEYMTALRKRRAERGLPEFPPLPPPPKAHPGNDVRFI